MSHQYLSIEPAFTTSRQSTTRLFLDYVTGDFQVTHNGMLKIYGADEVGGISMKKGWFYSIINFTASDASYSLDWLSHLDAKAFIHAAQNRFIFAGLMQQAIDIRAQYASVLDYPHYLSKSRFNALNHVQHVDLQPIIGCLAFSVDHDLLHYEGINVRLLLADIQDISEGNLRAEHNNKIMAAHEIQYADFFNKVEKTPLSPEQIKAVLVNEDRNLVVASAGSGKTSTIVGKVGYLIASGHSKPEEIITLAYAKDAAKELNQRISERLGSFIPNDAEIEASTFHALGLLIIGQATGQRPDICASSDVMINECINHLSKVNSEFSRMWQHFQIIYSRPIQTLPEFSSQDSYNSYLCACGARRKQGETLSIPTLNGDFVASMEEVLIANWLFCNGIQYQYERAYPYVTANQQRRQYHPDFYFPQADIYLEHLGIDKDGKPAPFLGSAYLESIKWKRELHKNKGTTLYETTSGMVHAGALFNFLGGVLDRHGITPSPRSVTDIQEALTNNNVKVQSNQQLVATFIHHLKSNELDPKKIYALKRISKGSREDLFLTIVDMVLTEYTRRLSSLHQVDFDDMIVSATKHLKNGDVTLPFKSYIVDEFQDLASARANLIKAALAQHQDSMLFAVGDDWQSIYRFAGSDISAMTRFEQQFGAPALSKLTKTYRSNQGITNAAAAFIQKNPAQIKKKVTAFNQTYEGVIDLVRYERNSHVVNAIFSEINRLIESSGKRPEIFILCRYKREIDQFVNSPYFKAAEKSASIKVKTFHSSKGLEADYVFIYGLNAGSFPSSIVDDPLLALAMPAPETFPMAEERRIFYVAMTRARHHVYAYAEMGNESSFFLEMEKYTDPSIINRKMLDQSGLIINQIDAVWCKECAGYMVQRLGKFGAFRGCSNYPDCTFTIDKHA